MICNFYKVVFRRAWTLQSQGKMAKSSKKNIIVLGGSYGGVSTAHYVLKHALPKLPDATAYQVILASASSEIFCRPTAPRALLSDDMFPQDKLFVPIATAFAQYSDDAFRFLQGTVTQVDHLKRTVSFALHPAGTSETMPFHALVIATGASTPSPLHSLTSTSDNLRASWASFREALPKAKTIVIAGGGPAGVETAGELGEVGFS